MIYGSANVLSAAVPFLLLPILTRSLKPEDYGIVVSFYMLVTIFTATSGLGLQSAVGVRWLDNTLGSPKAYTATAVLIVFFTTLTTGVLGSILAPFLGVDLQPEICFIAAIVAGTNVLQTIRFAIWQSQSRPLPAAMLQVGSACSNICLSLIGVFALRLGGNGRILGAFLSGLLIAGWSVFLLMKDDCLRGANSTDAKQLFRFGVPLIPHSLAGSLLGNADRFAVSAVLGTAILGVYGTAAQLGMIINVLADAAIKAYTPWLYRLLANNSLRSKLKVVAITYISIPIWIGSAFLIWGILITISPFLLGDKYQTAVHLSIWFLLGGAVFGVYLNIAGLFFFARKTEWISIATISATLSALALAKPAVLLLGVQGGGMAFLFVQIILLTLSWLLASNVFKMPWLNPALSIKALFHSPWR